VPEFETLVVPLGSTWVSLARTRGVFERDVLPGHLARSRWYPEHAPEMIRPTLVSAIPFCDIGDNRPWLAFFEAQHHGDGGVPRYVLPMQIEWVRFDREHYDVRAFSAVRQGAREGTLLDVATDQIFIGLMMRNLKQSLTVEENSLRLEFKPTIRFPDGPVRQPQRIQSIETGRLYSIALVDSEYVVKFHRKLEAGLDPEIEIGRHLAEVVGFANSPPLLGSAELVEGDARYAIATVHAFVANQGDGWTVSGAYLDRFVEKQRLLAASEHAGGDEELTPYLRYMSQAGKRAAEMHLALAASERSDFAPEPISPADVQRWINDVLVHAERAFDILEQRHGGVREVDRPLVDRALQMRGELHDRLTMLLPPGIKGTKIRLHGDFRLGQMLIVKDDIFIIGFEGKPGRPLAERRRKAPAARDLAELICSIDYTVMAALERAQKVAPEEHGSRLAIALSQWREHSTMAFLSGYREAMRTAPLWPTEPDAADAMLKFFLLERAVSGIEDELAYQPEWLRIPLGALLRILSEPARVTS
jgi:maltose alpha-D-glucosyltransferase/alpha-amylase